MIRSTLFLSILSLFWAATARADYQIDWSDQHTDKVFWSGSGLSTHGGTCEDYYDDGVVRSWYLKERNLRDYRKSYNYCRDMRSDGTLGSGYKKMSHFSYSGSGSTGNSSIPTDKLPVGVRTVWDFPLLGAIKLVDVELFFDDAADIADGKTNSSRAGDALNNSGARLDVKCDPGYVMTGLWVKAKHRAGGSNQAEIRGVKIQCSLLEEI